MKIISYVQLSLYERDRIAFYRAKGFSIREIGRRVHRDASTISRELRRNRPPIYNAYGAAKAQQRALRRKRQAGRRPRLKNRWLRAYVCRHLRCGWSPEQIAGRLAKLGTHGSVSHEAIYQFVYQPRVRRRENLVPCLTRAHRRRQLKGHRHTHREPQIPQRISIVARPRVVNDRRQFGHWESDTVQTRHGGSGLQVVVERKSRIAKIAKVPQRTAHNASRALTRTLGHYPKPLRRSITYDNGPENTNHLHVNRTLGTRSYFCEPFHSWEKGTVENTIGLIRRDLPKGTNFDFISQRLVKAIERRLNNRPRKILNFQTPSEIFRHAVALTH